MKKIKLFALAAFAMLSTNAFAAVGSEFIGNNGIRYKITKEYVAAAAGVDEQLGTVTVINYGLSTTTDAVVIPEIVGNQDATNTDVPTTNRYKVVGINGMETGAVTINGIDVNATTATQAFKNAKSASITLPTSILYIGKLAFEGCEAATIVIPAGSQLAKIDDAAFAKAANLTTFATENATWLANIGKDAFYGCAKLESMTLGAKLERIEKGAFVGTKIATLDLSTCNLLADGTSPVVAIERWFTATSATTFASGVTLGTATQYALADESNASLTKVVLPTTNAADYSIAADAFNGCTALATIGATANSAIIPAKVKAIGTGAFKKTAITKFDLSGNSTIAAIADWFSKTGEAIVDPSKLEQVILNSSFTAPAYSGFTGLTKISTLKKIGITGAEYTLPGSTAVSALAQGVFAGTALEQLDLSKIANGGTAYALPALFYSVATGVFNGGNASLTAVVLNEKVNELADNAFAGCSLLASLTVKKADGTAVENLTSLVTVNPSAFWQTKLSSLTFGVALETLKTPFVKPTTATTEAQGKLALSTADAITIDLSKATAFKGIIGTATAAATKLGDATFQGVAQLTSIKLPTNLTVIGANAFEGTGIAEIALPASIVQNATATDRGILANAFKDCKSLKKMTYTPAANTSSIFQDNTVFSGCSLVSIVVPAAYAAVGGPDQTDANTKKLAPTNSKWDAGSTAEVTTVKDKVKNQAMKGFYNDEFAYQFDAEECGVFEAYFDGDNIVMSPLRKRDGKFNVPAKTAVIVRTENATTIKPQQITIDGTTIKSSMVYGSMTDVNYKPTKTENVLASVKEKTAREAVKNNADGTACFGNYMYVLVNNATAGFSFQFYAGSYLNNGNIYVISSKAPEGAARLNMVWLDENGNVEEDDATAIKAIEAAKAENGAIYNLAGQKVNASYKGVVIKNGKKYIMK